MKRKIIISVVLVIAVVSVWVCINLQQRRRSQQNACISNLRIIEGAKEQYGMEYGLTSGLVITWEQIVGSDNFIKQYPLCPASATVRGNAINSAHDYNINPLGQNAACRIQPTGKLAHAF